MVLENNNKLSKKTKHFQLEAKKQDLKHSPFEFQKTVGKLDKWDQRKKKIEYNLTKDKAEEAHLKTISKAEQTEKLTTTKAPTIKD